MTMPLGEQKARRFLAIAATLGVLGVALNLNREDGTLPKIIAALGIVMLVWSIHRFGRLGADPPIEYEELEPLPKKKKKKKKKRDAASEAEPSTAEPSTAVASTAVASMGSADRAEGAEPAPIADATRVDPVGGGGEKEESERH